MTDLLEPKTETLPDPLETAIAQLPPKAGGHGMNLVPRRDGTPRRAKPTSKRTKPKGDYLSPRVKRAIVAMVFHGKDRETAAQSAGLKDSSFRAVFAMPKVRQFYGDCLDVLRSGAVAEGINTIIELNRGAESEHVRLQAAKYLDSEGQSDKQQVNVNVGIVNAPGYSIQMSEEQAQKTREILDQAGSTCSVLDKIDAEAQT